MISENNQKFVKLRIKRAEKRVGACPQTTREEGDWHTRRHQGAKERKWLVGLVKLVRGKGPFMGEVAHF
jgi:hypothetical protein